MTTDTSLFLPQLVKYCRKAVNENASYRRSVEERAARVKEAHDRAHEKWVDLARRSSSDTSITTADLASKIWSSIRDRDWVLAHGTLNGWARKLWSWTRPYHYHGDSGGGGLGYSVGASIGVALAYRGSGKLVISTIGDGDFLMACNGLWTAAHEKIPLLFVIVNNQSYHNDFEHQRRTAMERGRPIENARIGVSLDDPPPDYSSLAESLGCEGIRVEEAKMLDDALQRSIECVTKKNKP
ncbi:MAG: thiamine pyrophosphate-dependent enzyme, partial [Thaumarchaeota archaeon]|nr:thiamine pyrophosphate-dependent enzyme [Nitrososphaerota archaeon]